MLNIDVADLSQSELAVISAIKTLLKALALHLIIARVSLEGKLN